MRILATLALAALCALGSALPASAGVIGSPSVVLHFDNLAFSVPTDWTFSITDGCVEYKNISTAHSDIGVTPPGGSSETHSIPPGASVFACTNSAIIVAPE